MRKGTRLPDYKNQAKSVRHVLKKKFVKASLKSKEFFKFR